MDRDRAAASTTRPSTRTRADAEPDDFESQHDDERRDVTDRDQIGRIAAVLGRARRLLVVVVVTDHDQLTAVFGGIGTGALYAAIALGVVLTYKGSGVVNFANGATAMYVAYIYDYLRTQGEVFLPPLPNPLALDRGRSCTRPERRGSASPTGRPSSGPARRWRSGRPCSSRWSRPSCSDCCSTS